MDAQSFYDALSDIEQLYWHKLAELLSLVQPKYPERGIVSLIKKARAEAFWRNIPLSDALTEMYAAAEIRTLRRIALYGKCSIGENKQAD